MPQYDNTGIVSKNPKKTQDNHPDITGSATIDSVDSWVNGWQKKGSKGIFYSLSFKRKEEKPSREPGQDEDEIPF